MSDHVIVLGFGVGGQLVARALQGIGVPYLILELNGATVQRMKADGERSPARRAWDSSGDNGRTKRGGFIPPLRRSPCIGSVWNLH